MSFQIDTSDLPEPGARSASDWVKFYLRVENAVAVGRDVSVNGRRVSRDNLEEIVRVRNEWEQRMVDESSQSAGLRKRAPLSLWG